MHRILHLLRLALLDLLGGRYEPRGRYERPVSETKGVNEKPAGRKMRLEMRSVSYVLLIRVVVIHDGCHGCRSHYWYETKL